MELGDVVWDAQFDALCREMGVEVWVRRTWKERSSGCADLHYILIKVRGHREATGVLEEWFERVIQLRDVAFGVLETEREERN